MDGFPDQETGEARRGFVEIVTELGARFPDSGEIGSEADKKEFVKPEPRGGETLYQGVHQT